MHVRIALRVRLPFCRGLHCRVSLRGWLRLALCRIPFSALRSLLQLRCLVAAGCAVAPSAVLFRLRLRCGHAQSCNAFYHAVRRCRLSLARTVWAVHAPVHVADFSISRGSAALLIWSFSWFLRFLLSGCCLHTPRVCAHACAFS